MRQHTRSWNIRISLTTCVPLAAFVVVAVALHVEVDVRARSEASHAYKANDLASAHCLPNLRRHAILLKVHVAAHRVVLVEDLDVVGVQRKLS
jgi:hypothetical protein